MAEFEALRQAIIENGLKRSFKLVGEGILEKVYYECNTGCEVGCAIGCAIACSNSKLNGNNGNNG